MDFQTYTKERNKKFEEQFCDSECVIDAHHCYIEQPVEELKVFLSDERSSLVEFLLDEMPKKGGKLKGEDKEREIHHRGYDEALDEVTALLESYLLWANSTADEQAVPCSHKNIAVKNYSWDDEGPCHNGWKRICEDCNTVIEDFPHGRCSGTCG